MKKTITKQTHVCDKCGSTDDYPDECINCGVEYCHKCADKLGIHYRHAIHFCGSGDGFYCNTCDGLLSQAGTNKRHAAYQAVRSLSNELEAWGIDFKKRQEAAEKMVESLSE